MSSVVVAALLCSALVVGEISVTAELVGVVVVELVSLLVFSKGATEVGSSLVGAG